MLLGIFIALSKSNPIPPAPTYPKIAAYLILISNAYKLIERYIGKTEGKNAVIKLLILEAPVDWIATNPPISSVSILSYNILETIAKVNTAIAIVPAKAPKPNINLKNDA